MNTPHLRLAMMTNNLVQVDANFAAARQAVFYDVTADDSEFVDVVHFGLAAKRGPGGGKGCQMEDMGDDDGAGRDPLAERVEAIAGSSILFTLGLSDLAAVRLHERRVFPVKSERVRHIDDVVTQVQRLLRENPPLWVRRVMRGAGGKRLLLDEQSL